MSKRKKVTVAVVLSLSILISLTFLVYAFIKADEDKKLGVMLDIARQESEMLRVEAVGLKQMAMEAAAEALQQQLLAEKALQDCQTNTSGK
ncbi:hypothetical protein [Ekhidna sp.]|uniref:hypothetical protein n=1 Tax=Ekhidna sp. TaxID=2608089 RepID=UPI0032999F75